MFADVYSNELSKYGFVRAKGKYPYIVRFVSEDIINIITYKNSNHSNQGAKSFFVLCDIATVYRSKISLDKSPEANAWWMHNSESIIARMGHSREQYSYTYRCFDEDDMYKTIIESLDDIKNYILPLFDSVKTLSSCIDYYDEFGGFMSIIVDSNFGTNANYNEGHLYIIANKKQDFGENVKTKIEHYIEKNKKAGIILTDNDIEKKRESLITFAEKQKKYMNYILNNKEVKDEFGLEMQRRKSYNLDKLKEYGIMLREE